MENVLLFNSYKFTFLYHESCSSWKRCEHRWWRFIKFIFMTLKKQLHCPPSVVTITQLQCSLCSYCFDVLLYKLSLLWQWSHWGLYCWSRMQHFPVLHVKQYMCVATIPTAVTRPMHYRGATSDTSLGSQPYLLDSRV